MSNDGRLATADIIGTWRLLSWETSADGEPVERPFGEHPLGYVVYTPDGHMITTISMADRPLTGGDLLSSSDADRARAFGTFQAYSGTFRVDGDDVVHIVEMSLFPDWSGTEQHRHVGLSADGSTLTLSTDPIPTSGGMRRHRLAWERVTA